MNEQARRAAARSVDQILTLRSWLIGTWIVAYEQEGRDRARYGERLIVSLAAAFRARDVSGLQASNLRNCRQIALTWPRLGIRQTVSGELAAEILQTVSGDSVPAALSQKEVDLPWRDEAWMDRVRTELSFSTGTTGSCHTN